MSERKAIFITGGGSGIGRAVAIHFAERGWFVGLADIDEQGMEVTRGMINNGFTHTQQLDVRERAAWDEALNAFSVAAGGRIDVVFNNAGIAKGGLLVEMSQEDLDQMIAINLNGVFYGAQASHKHLKKAGPGSALINTASMAGFIGGPGMAGYCATKWGVRAMTEALDAEWLEDGIKVASICPGFIDTPLIAQTVADSNQSLKEALQEGGVEISPVSDVANAVWNAVHGDKLDYMVGKSASRIRFLKRFLPGMVRKQMREQGVGAEF